MTLPAATARVLSWTCVLVFVCPRSYLRNYTYDLHQIVWAYYIGSAAVLLSWRSDTFCTWRFYGWRHVSSWAKVARRRRPAEAQRTRSLGLGYKACAVIPVASQRTHGTTTFRALEVTSQVATTGAESAAYDCLVVVKWQHDDDDDDDWGDDDGDDDAVADPATDLFHQVHAAVLEPQSRRTAPAAVGAHTALARRRARRACSARRRRTYVYTVLLLRYS